MSPRYTIGTNVRVKSEMLTKTLMGVVVGIKLEEKELEKVDSTKPVKEAINRNYLYLISGHTNNWYYEWSLVPMIDRLTEVKKDSEV